MGPYECTHPSREPPDGGTVVVLTFYRKELKHKEVDKVRLLWLQNGALDHYRLFQQRKGSQGPIKTHLIWQTEDDIRQSSFESRRSKSQVKRGFTVAGQAIRPRPPLPHAAAASPAHRGSFPNECNGLPSPRLKPPSSAWPQERRCDLLCKPEPISSQPSFSVVLDLSPALGFPPPP